MAVGKSGDKHMGQTKAKCEGPGGVKSGPSTFSNTPGVMGYKKTYHQTGKPGKGSR